MFHHFLTNKLFESESIIKRYSEQRVFVLSDQNEELYWPSLCYSLNSNEVKKLKHFYSQLFQVSKKKLEVNIYILVKFYNLFIY